MQRAREDITAKRSHSICVICILLLCIIILTFISSNMAFDSMSFFFGASSTSQQDPNMILSYKNKTISPPTPSPTISITTSTLKPSIKPSISPTPPPITSTTTTSTAKPTNKPIATTTTTTSTAKATNKPIAITTTTSIKSTPVNIEKNNVSKNTYNNISILKAPKLISIGGIFTGTSTLEQIICQITEIQCCLPSIHDKSQYKGNYDYTSSMLNNSIFLQNNYIPNINITRYGINDLDLTLSTFRFDVEGILKYIPLNKYISSHCDLRKNNDGNKDLFIRNTIYFQNPVTAAIFAYFALHYETKTIFQIREPIDRWWSSDLSEPNSYSYNAYIVNKQFTETLLNLFGNTSYSDDYIISLYYQRYFTLKGLINFQMINSYYCVHILFWIKQFDLLLEKNSNSYKKTSDYFKIIQTRYLLDNIIETVQMIYCWEKGECNDDIKKKIVKNINFATVVSPDINIGDNRDRQNWEEMKQKIKIFQACNQRLDRIIKKRPDLVLGEWKSWNAVYKEEEKRHNS